MGITIGPADWWVASPDGIDSLAISCPEAITLPDGSRVICKAGGKAWIIAPCTTQVSEPWGNVTACGCIDNLPAGISVHSDITSENFPCLYNQLISCGFNPYDWFVPCLQLLQNPGYLCRTKWDTFGGGAGGGCYWSSTECTDTAAFRLCYYGSDARYCPADKATIQNVRAMRCVNY
jgi:hypothetical protein